MRKQMLALLDSESDYAVRFMNYTNRRRTAPFKICAFTGWDEFREFTSTHRIETLLISERDAKEHHAELNHLKGRMTVIVLSEEAPEGRREGTPSIWRYQPASTIISNVMTLSGMTAPDMKQEGLLKGRTQFIGVYSPVGRIGKTLFARELAAHLTASRSTLLLNFEAFPYLEKPEGTSGRRTLPPSSGKNAKEPSLFAASEQAQEPGAPLHDFEEAPGNLSDLLYFLLGGESNLVARLLSLVREEGGVSCIPPSRHPAELLKLSEDDWYRLFQMIRRESPYETIVLDLGLIPVAAPCLLEECDILYMPVLGDHCSMRKAALAEDNLLEYSEDLSAAIRKVDFSEAVSSGPIGSGSVRLHIAELAADCIGRDRL